MPSITSYSVPVYESIEFNLATGQTNYSLDTNQTTFLSVFGATSNFGWPTKVVFRTNQTVTVKFNSTSNHGITVASTDSPLTWIGEVRDIYITNASGSTAAIKILCQKN